MFPRRRREKVLFWIQLGRLPVRRLKEKLVFQGVDECPAGSGQTSSTVKVGSRILFASLQSCTIS